MKRLSLGAEVLQACRSRDALPAVSRWGRAAGAQYFSHGEPLRVTVRGRRCEWEVKP